MIKKDIQEITWDLQLLNLQIIGSLEFDKKMRYPFYIPPPTPWKQISSIEKKVPRLNKICPKINVIKNPRTAVGYLSSFCLSCASSLHPPNHTFPFYTGPTDSSLKQTSPINPFKNSKNTVIIIRLNLTALESIRNQT